MRGNARQVACLLSSIGWLALSVPALAQTSDPSQASDGDSIVVTARRVEERLQDVPISISVLSQQQITNRNIVTAADLGTYTPSLATNSRFGPDKTSFAIRGFVQEIATAPSVGVYFADVVGIRSAGATTGGSGSGPGSFFDLQNVQVLKGPQGTLFGRNTTGGAVLLVPQKPTFELGGYVEGTLGDYKQRRVQAVLNVPLSDTFRVRLGVDRNKRDGYLKNHTDIGPDDGYANINYLAARLSIVADLTPDLENYTIATYSRSDTNSVLPHVLGCDAGLAATNPATGRPFSPLARAGCDQIARQSARGDGFWGVEASLPNPRSLLEQWQVINTTTWRASDTLTVKNILSYGEYREQTRNDIYGYFWPEAPKVTFPFIVASHAPGQRNGNQSGFTEELQLQGHTPDNRLTWTVGGYMEISKPLGRTTAFNPIGAACTDYLALQCQTSNFSAAGALTSTSWIISVEDYALFGQATYKIADRLSVTGGLRYTWDNTASYSENLRIFFPSVNTPLTRCANNLRFPDPTTNTVGKIVTDRAQCHIDFEQKSRAPTWMIDAEYKPTDDTMVYAKWSRGYRQGFINPNIVAFETWNPEKVDTYEIGGKATFSGALRGYVNIAAFYNDFRDQQIQVAAQARPGAGSSGVNLTFNAGKSVIKGVEIDASITPFTGFKFDLGYAFLDARLKNFIPPVLPANSPYLSVSAPVLNTELNLTPRNRVTLTGTYELPLPESVGRIALGATYTHTDRQRTNPDLTPTGARNPFAFLPASDLVNLNANWNSVLGSPVDVGIFVTNVTNEQVHLNYISGYASTGVESVIPGEPRIFGARLRYHFGS